MNMSRFIFFFSLFQVNHSALEIPTLHLTNCDYKTEYVVTFSPTIPVRKFNKKYPAITFYAPEEVHIRQSCKATLKDLEPVHITVTAACYQETKPGFKPIVPVLLETTPVWNATDFSLLKVWVCLVIQLRKQLFALTWLLSL